MKYFSGNIMNRFFLRDRPGRPQSDCQAVMESFRQRQLVRLHDQRTRFRAAICRAYGERRQSNQRSRNGDFMTVEKVSDLEKRNSFEGICDRKGLAPAMFDATPTTKGRYYR